MLDKRGARYPDSCTAHLDGLLAMQLLLQLQQLSHEASIWAGNWPCFSDILQGLLQSPVLGLHEVGQGQGDGPRLALCSASLMNSVA